MKAHAIQVERRKKEKILNSKQFVCYRAVRHFPPLDACIKPLLSWNLIFDGITLTATFQCAGVMVVIHHPKKNRTAPVIRKSSGGKNIRILDVS